MRASGTMRRWCSTPLGTQDPQNQCRRTTSLVYISGSWHFTGADGTDWTRYGWNWRNYAFIFNGLPISYPPPLWPVATITDPGVVGVVIDKIDDSIRCTMDLDIEFGINYLASRIALWVRLSPLAPYTLLPLRKGHFSPNKQLTRNRSIFRRCRPVWWTSEA